MLASMRHPPLHLFSLNLGVWRRLTASNLEHKKTIKPLPTPKNRSLRPKQHTLYIVYIYIYMYIHSTSKRKNKPKPQPQKVIVQNLNPTSTET